MNDELKAVRNLGAELGAAKAENEKLHGLLREVIACQAAHYGDATDLHLAMITLADRLKGALSQQADPAETTEAYTAVDMATAAAQGFRDGQAAVDPAAAKDERKTFEAWAKTQGDKWLIVGGLQWSAGTDDYASARTNAAWAAWQERAARPAQTEQQPVAVPEDFQPLETIRWWISAYTNPENGPSYQGHGMMVQMLCEYEALRIMLSSRAQQRPTAYPHEAMDKLAADRYRVGAAGAGTLHGFAVRAGDGEQELYRGRKSDCEHVARKLAGAFLDGGFTAFERYAAPIAQTEQQPAFLLEIGADGEYAVQVRDKDWLRSMRNKREHQTHNLYSAPIAQTAPQGKFRMGDLVKKSTGSEWVGRVVGWYSTEQTKEGYAVESSAHRNSVQIYPVTALEAVE